MVIVKDSGDSGDSSSWLLVRIVDLEIVARRTRKGGELAAYLIALDDIRAVIRTAPKI
jgi:hypothetical protein